MSLERVRGRLAPPLAELCAIALVTGALAVFFALALPPHGDASAHFYRTFLVRRGDFLWDNYWYGGEYPLASYSLLYYLPAALLGNTVVAVAAAVAASVVFAAVAWDVWGEDARWAARIFSVFAVEPLLQTEYPFALAVPLLLASLGFLRRGRTRLGALFAALTLGVSPLAFAFLCLAAAGLFLVRPRLDRRAVASSLALGLLVLCAAALSWSFATPWSGYPFPTSALVRILVVSGLGVALASSAAPRWNGGGIYAVWGLAGLVGFVVPTPVGANLDRPAFLLVPLLLVPAARLAPRVQPVAAMGVFLALTLSTGTLQSSLASAFVPHENEVRLWRPVVAFLRSHDSPSFRVEVVPTAGHWEAYFLPRAGIPIARGWYRQLDLAANGLFYARHLSRSRYLGWLRRMAVRYVVLPRAESLDGRGATAEARLLRSGRSGLRLVAETRAWSYYELRSATPLLRPDRLGTIRSFGPDRITGVVRRAGAYFLDVTYMRWWDASPHGLRITRAPDGMTILHVPRPGRFRLRAGTVLPDVL
jgi:hypothetical protein